MTTGNYGLMCLKSAQVNMQTNLKQLFIFLLKKAKHKSKRTDEDQSNKISQNNQYCNSAAHSSEKPCKIH